MPPEGYYEDWWDKLVRDHTWLPAQQPNATFTEYVSPYNVGDVLVGEIVEERKELA
jgi:hypothetical protein